MTAPDTSTQEIIADLTKRLEINRRTLAHLLQQAAQHGGEVFAPPATVNGIAEARFQIHYIKTTLRGWSIDVNDHPDDVSKIKRKASSEYDSIKTLCKQMDTIIKCLTVDNPLFLDDLNIPLIWEESNSQKPKFASDIVSIFLEAERGLLIRGACGNGKTTMLLKLADGLIKRREIGSNQPAPVLFSLTSWAKNTKRSIAEWLIDDLDKLYHIPRSKGKILITINNEKILPLLDDLDEVEDKYRNTCIRAIHEFTRKYKMRLVVCSYTSNSDGLEISLNLDQVITLKTFKYEQVKESLGSGQPKYLALTKTFQENQHLQSMYFSPFMLGVISNSPQNISDTKFLPSMYRDDFTRLLVTIYIENMLTSKLEFDTKYPYRDVKSWSIWLASKIQAEYPYKDVKSWLIWLASKMQDDHQVIFSPETYH